MSDFFVICLKYSPAHWQHMKSFVSCLQERGYQFHFILSRHYRWMNRDFEAVTSYLTSAGTSFISVLVDVLLFTYRWFYFLKIFRNRKPDEVLFALWHPMNSLVAKIVKKVNPHCQIYFWIHEPYKEDKSVYKKKALIISIIEYIQEKTLPLTDVAIVHSRRGFEAFKIRYPHYQGTVKVIPLGYRDEHQMTADKKRDYDLTFFGTAAQAKGIEEFFAFVRTCLERNTALKIQLVTSSNIERYLKELPPQWKQWLTVANKATISDAEIRVACARSYAVFAPYRETTQSGAIPVAFMNGAPVIGTDIEGLHEYIQNRRNGIFIPVDFSFDDVISALDYIKEHYVEMSQSARKSFEDIWSDKNWDKYYHWLLES
ncbi:glycosyltransferase [candidate division CSSED10-310 bacterium]|uniref:Glycosyltransferase n=1 Tax=candidate division CSSED10-310 bacterium TaxID=2855610 RepID=A0ABV6YW03_UNCC1